MHDKRKYSLQEHKETKITTFIKQQILKNQEKQILKQIWTNTEYKNED